MTISLALQILTIAVAAVGPFLAYRFARKLSLSGNRQAWLDALREDIAVLLSLIDHTAILAITKNRHEAAGVKFEDEQQSANG